MRNIFVISDTHFSHQKILNFVDYESNHVRSFTDIDEMDNTMLENWNKVVKDNDIVYHLGDVFFDKGHKILPHLKGRKRLILGNHDNAKSKHITDNFQKIMMWRMFPDLNCVLTHVPIHETSIGKVQYNLHGHIHRQKSPSERHINCCVEVNNYTPVSIEDIMKGK